MAFQSECPDIHFDSEVSYGKTRFKYASLGAIISTVQPVLAKHGLVFTQLLDDEGVVITRLYHAESGESIESSLYIKAKSNDPQGVGSAITYAKRYSLSSMLGIVAEDDDDAKSAARPVQQKKSPVKMLPPQKFEDMIAAVNTSKMTINEAIDVVENKGYTLSSDQQEKLEELL